MLRRGLPVSRRQFLIGAAASSALVAAGCSDDDSKREGEAQLPATPSTRPGPRLPSDPFMLGVASGDPLHDRVILWSRLAPTPLAGGLAGMPDDRVDVVWEVATDERFTKLITQGAATADPASAHSLHVDADGLEPATDYFYRFKVGDWTSPPGRTRTLAAPGEALRRLDLGVVTCQSFGTGYYAAYRHLLDEDLDLVVHLGDYIYELPFATVAGRDLPGGVPATLEDYRLRHAAYRMDADLQQAHARFPFMCMWDDHEVTNNYAGDTTPTDADPESVRQLRAAAYRAYWEHLPLRLSPPDGPEVTLYRDVAFGDLARLCLLDERQYAEEPPCRDEGASGDLGVCPARADERQYLGAAQEQWFSDAVAQGGVTWNLVGNPTVIAGVNMGDATAPAYYLDAWDGYPAARRRFLSRLADPAVSNPVLLTGDWHAGMVNDVHLDPDDHATPVVATELMTPAISSLIFDAPRPQNPQIRHFVAKHGYMTVAVEPERVTATFRVLDDVARADSGISTESTWQVAAGQPGAQPA